jgi:hypothetical protein
MKTLISCNVGLLLLFMTSCSILKTTPETISETTKKVESKDFTIEVNYANPLRMKPVYLTSDYTLRIKNDSVFAYLPYYGVAHVAPFDSSEGGIKFETLMTGYEIHSNKKSNGWNIRFKVKPSMFEYNVYLNVFNNGSAMISFDSYQRDAISFNGEVKQ